ncbi:PstS family phosphate ABC transporter substrate-binding protein [Photobacterium halotolerans]|uniref:Phosphate-binding protein n=1 Tax=Photobacterium halotolerans TaxID=265726 RepID=A0A7X5BMK0_9GAMM|nr:PstS family phosphate ABC transporter substrate-binding protein [Photobacterium halotolerans]NAW66592.1 phosphate ABC transporter substrate-binding protein PstS family protein [Photobacterium halotolerans]NAW87264.1 phosphate ABC transporter substrate-binding protein PstS family protein [Photobacterium halotolerans]NAX48858.1 phosphate ABC transporter substrate-binding protein PstS family protein [Photobacterium halotolerans]
MNNTLPTVLLGACIATLATSAHARELVKIDGSSTVFPIAEAMAEEFQIEEKGKTMVTVGISGTGGGFKKFCRGETDISNASRPIKDSERKICAENGIEFIELPAALDALTIVINPENNWVTHLNIEDLKKAWEPAAQGKITSWKQVNASFPDRPLKLFGPGTDSGTYDYFVEAVVEGKSSRGDYTASEDDNVIVQGVASDVNALGFFGLAYYEENKNKLKAAPISWNGSKAVSPSVETAKNGTYQPLSRPIFIYVNKQSADNKPHVERFVNFFMSEDHAPQLVKEVGYVPLPEKAYKLAQDNFKARRTGSVFHGAEVGIGIEELLARTPK